MQAFLIYSAYAAIILMPLAFMLRYLFRPPAPAPIPTITALLYLRWSIAPVVLYAAVFLILAIIEELGGTTIISRDYQHSLLLAIGVGIPWVLLLMMLVLVVASRRFHRGV